MTYSTSTTGRGGVLVADDFEVLALAYLRKGNTSVAGVDNSSVELEVVIAGETLAFLGQKPGLLQSQLLLFSEGVVSDEERIVSLKADNTKGLIAIEEAGVVS